MRLFDAHWEASGGQIWKQGPQEATLAVALRWARSCATGVIVHTADGARYSAGEMALEELPGWTFGDQPPELASRDWFARVTIPGEGEASRQAAERAASSLLQESVLRSVRIERAKTGDWLVTGIFAAVDPESTLLALDQRLQTLGNDVASDTTSYRPSVEISNHPWSDRPRHFDEPAVAGDPE